MENFGPNGLDKKTVNKPSEIFSQQILPLRNLILKKFEEIDDVDSSKYKIVEWLQFASNFWAFSGNF